MKAIPVTVTLFTLLLVTTIPGTPAVAAEFESVPVESERWRLVNAERTERLERTCLSGNAFLDQVEFENGTIEVDIAVREDTRSYPGIVFRVQSPGNYEHVYIRPHRAPLYPDAVQYAPSFNGISGWQLFNGNGYSAAAEIPGEQWLRLRLEVLGTQARVYLGESEQPVLVVDDLQHGASKGSIGLQGPRDGTACFSNFRYRLGGELKFDPPPPVDRPAGMITEWELSRTFTMSDVDTERHPSEQELPELEWKAVTTSPSGLLDVSRHAGRNGRAPDVIFARTTIQATREEVKEYRFGYSDAIAIFLNGKILFSGSSGYRQRDPSFLGIVGLHDSIYLPLREGKNELLLMVAESFGGWAFIFRDAAAVFEGPGVRKAWETGEELLTPESVAFDPARGVLYVSNYDAMSRSGGPGAQYLSRLSADGEILDAKWVAGLSRPTGMALSGDRLFVVERGGLAEIDIEAAEIVARHAIPQAMFPNDVAIDANGAIYVTDSARSVIYRIVDGAAEVWLEAPEVAQPNGLLVHDGRLIWGNNGDGRVKACDLDDKSVRLVAVLGDGIIDGIQPDGGGGYLVTHWEGRMYRIDAAGKVTKLLDTTAPQGYLADFAHVGGKNLLVVPTFFGNTVSAYTLSD